jgi:hypothetical protein
MVRAVSDDEQFAAEFQRQVNCRRLVKRLFAIRSARGISRHALARHIGCSPRPLSRYHPTQPASILLPSNQRSISWRCPASIRPERSDPWMTGRSIIEATSLSRAQLRGHANEFRSQDCQLGME